jgi:glutamyl-tRNA reductase
MKQGEVDATEAGRAGDCPSVTFTVPRPTTGAGCPVTDRGPASAPPVRTSKRRRNGSSDHPMRIAVLGTSNRTSELALRERLAFPPYDLAPAVAVLGDSVPHCVILSTCQRVEIYVAAPTLAGVKTAVRRFWKEQRSVSLKDIDAHTYWLEDESAVEHLFSVASGLDSMIVGEPQILGQVRTALEVGLEQQTAGHTLSGLFRAALTVGKRARNETAIGRNAASISSAAVELASQIVRDLRSARVMLVGAGKMGELAAKNLVSKGVAGLAVVGRSSERAERLALECDGAVAMTQLEDALPDSDIVISATNAPHQIITKEQVERAMAQRPERPLVLVDIAMPRDIDPAAGEVPGVYLCNVDDLDATVAANINERIGETDHVRAIVDDEVLEFQQWLNVRRAVGTIAALRNYAEEIRQSELARTSAVLERLSDDDRRRIEALTLAFEKKLLHKTITMLRAEAANGNHRHAESAVRELFALDV